MKVFLQAVWWHRTGCLCLTEELCARGIRSPYLPVGITQPGAPGGALSAVAAPDKHRRSAGASQLLALPAGESFDIHFHIDYMHFPLSVDRTYHSNQLHGRFDLPDLIPSTMFLYYACRVNFDSQRAPLPWLAGWGQSITACPKTLALSGRPRHIPAFGRIAPEKVEYRPLPSRLVF